MTTEALAKAIESKIKEIEIDLQFLSRPENLAASDGEYIGSKIAKDGLNELSELQDLFDRLQDPKKKTAPA